jgi:hypothetical protein
MILQPILLKNWFISKRLKSFQIAIFFYRLNFYVFMPSGIKKFKNKV